MSVKRRNDRKGGEINRSHDSSMGKAAWSGIGPLGCVLSFALLTSGAGAQVSVVTAHNDIGRTGQNLSETILTPAVVVPSKFGKLFSQPVNGGMYAQPLYVPQVAIPGSGTHNVVYAATSDDYVYAYDADVNGGSSALPLWKVLLLTNTSPSGTYKNEYGVTGTPVIDPTSKTLFLVSSELQGSTPIYRLHALDIATGKEKFGGPVQIAATVPGTGTGSTGGKLAFNPNYELQRAGLLLLNGVLYVPFGSFGDNGPWHGWLFSYSASTLAQINAMALSPNGSGGGIWMGGAGLAAEVNDTSKPYGRMFVTTGNGAYSASQPYTATMSYGMTVLDLDLTNGIPTVEDEFTPYNWYTLNGQDGDLGSSGPVLLPKQTVGSGQTLSPLMQIGKSGMIYILDRNSLGGFNEAGDQVVQEVQTPQSGVQNWGAGIWGSAAYWNNNLYFGGTNPGASNSLTAYSFSKGVLSLTPTSQTTEQFAYPGPTPSISSNNGKDGIVWAVKENGSATPNNGILFAFDATDLGNLLYTSNANLARDNPGPTVKFEVPTIANGKAYVGSWSQLNIYGLLGVTPAAATPTFSPAGGTYSGTQTVTLSDATNGAQIYYTTDGSTPTVYSKLYSHPITVSSSETVTAVASVSGELQSSPGTATYNLATNTGNPVFSLAAGTYSGTQTLSLTDPTGNATIYYTVDGSTPTTASPVYSAPIIVSVTETVQAFASSSGLLPSTTISATYQIQPVYKFNFTQGFAQAQSSGQMQFNGSTDLDDFRLQLTNGGPNEAGSAFYTTPVNIQAFTTDFTFQLSNPTADGITFTIQNAGLGALGGRGGALGYSPMATSVAIKFDLYNNEGEGTNSTGIYLNGAAPTVPSISLANSGINLHSGDYIDAHVTYDGLSLNLTLSDEVTLATWSTSFPIRIPAVVGANTAFVGFTGGTGGGTSSQKITSWTYVEGPPAVPNYPAGYDSGGLILNGGSALSGSALQLSNGTANQNTSAFYQYPVDVDSFTTDFDFQITDAAADGFTFLLQNSSPNARGQAGGGLGYGSIPHSIAIKFDIYNNAGEGDDSTGLYLNGAHPTVPSINLSSSGLHLASGDVIHAHITYDGTTLTWTLTDQSVASPPTVTESVVINIPQTIGNNTAYAGFTASTGVLTAVQSILDWTFSNNP